MKDYMYMAMALLRKRGVYGMVNVGEIDKLADYLYEHQIDGTKLTNEEIKNIIGRN